MSKLGRELWKIALVMLTAVMIISQSNILVSAAESDGVSSYTVEFTYNDLQYILAGGESIALSEILSKVGLEGEAAEVTVSDPELFSASKEDGRWMITSHKAFSSDEWMRVTVGDVTYEITVTDAPTTSGTYGSNLTWTLEGSTLTFSGTGAMEHWSLGLDALPWYSDRGSIQSVVIENGITSIGNQVFSNCNNLTNVSIPSSVTSIESHAFDNCTNLSSIELPSGLMSIGVGAFLGCTNLSSIELPSGLMSIGDGAFSGCTSLSSIELPTGLTSIGNGAFLGCTNLLSINIPSGITSVEDYTFSGCIKLESIELPTGLTSIGLNAFSDCTELESIDLPTSLTSIGNGAFSGCTSLSSIELPTGLTSIGNGAFSGCTSLSSITVPSTLTNIGNVAFMASPITTVNYDGTSAGWDSIKSKFPDTVIIPNYVFTAAPSPSVGGTVNVTGDARRVDTHSNAYTYTQGQSVTLTAVANDGYQFVNWTKNGTLVDTSAAYTFSAEGCALVANFTPVITIDTIADHTYDGSAYTPTVTVKFGTTTLTANTHYTLAYKKYNGSTWDNTTTVINVGNYRVEATGKDGTDYAGLTATKEFSITARSVTITAASEEFTYDGMAHTNSTVTVTSGSLPDGDTLTASATGSVTNVSDTVTGNNPIASGYTIMHGTTDVTSNYNITAVAGTLTITPKSVTITAQDKEFTPTGSAQSWPYYDVAGLVGNDAITAVITGSITEASESPVANVVTSYEFTTGTPGNYTVTTVNGQLTMPAPPSHVHSYTSVVTTEPTCTEAGVRKYTCSGCGNSYTKDIPPLGHDYVGKITKPVSAQEDGIKTYTCSRCHDSYTESIPKHEPTLEEGIEMIKQLIGELEGDGEHKVEVDVKTEKKDDGTTETVVTVGDEEILKITTDEDGEEKIESNIWSIGGDGNFTYTGVAIKPEILVFDGLKRLSLGSDFTVSYKNNVNAGAKAEAKVGFRGGYSETSAIKTNFTIDPADLEKNATAPAMIIASNGKAQKPIPEITITESGKSLGKSDLKYTYLDSEKKEVSVIKDAGDYTVEAVPKKTGGNLTGKITVPITVTGDKTKLLSNGKVNLAKKSYVYTGKPIIPDKDTYSLTIDGTKLTEGKDYTLTVSKNIEPGKATMIFTAADGNEDGYVGSIKAVFTITKGKELKPAGDGSDFKYTYEENAPFAKGGAKPEVTVKDGDKTLTKDVDYKVSYDKNKKITEGNTAVMTVTGKGNYKGKVTLYYAVVPQDIAALASGIEVQDKAVSSKGYKNPKVTITDENGKTLSKNNDYEFVDDYTEPDKDGNVTVTIKGKGAYMGTVPVTYRYLEAAALIDKVNASKIADKTYTGSPIRLTKKEAAKLLYTGKGKDINYLTWGEDFEIVRYENNTKTGTAKVILRGIGTHGGTRTVTFKIKSAKKTGLKIIISKLFNK